MFQNMSSIHMPAYQDGYLHPSSMFIPSSRPMMALHQSGVQLPGTTNPNAWSSTAESGARSSGMPMSDSYHHAQISAVRYGFQCCNDLASLDQILTVWGSPNKTVV
ncbi:transcription factor GATA-4 [Caerostris darwini]|uniref:Transcription factor GATA-4 n=1 Tax=Caerostris darwini TaxID=1538125 RepID=A0AAV4TJP6_9ARAC|nr:transcription factor GATA-4 [Caerostris darwini]